MNKLIEEKVVRATLEEIKLKNGDAALTLYSVATLNGAKTGDGHTHLHLNPSGKFIIGGPQGDAPSQAAKSSLTPTAAGALMVAVPFPAKTPQRSTDPQHTSAGR